MIRAFVNNKNEQERQQGQKWDKTGIFSETQTRSPTYWENIVLQ